MAANELRSIKFCNLLKISIEWRTPNTHTHTKFVLNLLNALYRGCRNTYNCRCQSFFGCSCAHLKIAIPTMNTNLIKKYFVFFYTFWFIRWAQSAHIDDDTCQVVATANRNRMKTKQQQRKKNQSLIYWMKRNVCIFYNEMYWSTLRTFAVSSSSPSSFVECMATTNSNIHIHFNREECKRFRYTVIHRPWQKHSSTAHLFKMCIYMWMNINKVYICLYFIPLRGMVHDSCTFSYCQRHRMQPFSNEIII